MGKRIWAVAALAACLMDARAAGWESAWSDEFSAAAVDGAASRIGGINPNGPRSRGSMSRGTDRGGGRPGCVRPCLRLRARR